MLKLNGLLHFPQGHRKCQVQLYFFESKNYPNQFILDKERDRLMTGSTFHTLRVPRITLSEFLWYNLQLGDLVQLLHIKANALGLQSGKHIERLFRLLEKDIMQQLKHVNQKFKLSQSFTLKYIILASLVQDKFSNLMLDSLK